MYSTFITHIKDGISTTEHGNGRITGAERSVYGIPASHNRRRSPQAFSLLESLIAVTILLGIVAAVTSAITAGQQNADEARQRVLGTLAAEDIMGRLITKPYAELIRCDSAKKSAGMIGQLDGTSLPESFAPVGWAIEVKPTTVNLDDLDVTIRGVELRVRAFDNRARELADLRHFVREPAE